MGKLSSVQFSQRFRGKLKTVKICLPCCHRHRYNKDSAKIESATDSFFFFFPRYAIDQKSHLLFFCIRHLVGKKGRKMETLKNGFDFFFFKTGPLAHALLWDSPRKIEKKINLWGKGR